MPLPNTLRRWSLEDAQVQDSAFRRNLQVLGVAAWALVALNVLHVLVFGLLRFDDPVRSAWAQQIAWGHGVMALLMCGAGVLARWCRARRVDGGALRFLPECVSVLVVAWAVALTVMDQAISRSISPFVNAVVGVAIVFLLRPRSALVILVAGWCALAWALGLTTDDRALLATNRMNAASACVLALLVSVLLWRRFAQAELLQRALAESNRKLELQRAELEKLATRDPLTGLLNRREFVRQAEQELARARRLGGSLALLMVDLDHFKAVNDHFGHPAGDEVLRHVSGLMAQAVRGTDLLARFGGEEFVLLLPDTPADHALHLADKLRQRLAGTPVAVLGAPVTASIGLACPPAGCAVALDDLLRHADLALYQAKREGRNRTVAAEVPVPAAVLPSGGRAVETESE